MRSFWVAAVLTAAAASSAAAQTRAQARVDLTVSAPAAVARWETDGVRVSVPARGWRLVERTAGGERSREGAGGVVVVRAAQAAERPREVTLTVWTL